MSWKSPVIDDERRYEVYLQAMRVLRDRTRNEGDHVSHRLWATRIATFDVNRTSKRTVWLNWVEANAERIPWCGQLVLEAVSQALGIES